MAYFRWVPFLRPPQFLLNSAISSSISYPSLFQILSNRLLFFAFSSSSSSAALQNSKPNLSNSHIISEFLIGDCGFSQSRLALLQKRHPRLWRSTSIEKARQIVDIFRNYVSSDSQLEKVLLCSRRALSCGDAESLQKKLKIMESFGFTKEDIVDLVSRCPWIVHVKDMNRNTQSLLAVFGNAKNVMKAVKSSPVILTITPDKVGTQIERLRQAGFDDSSISGLIRRCPSILQARPDTLLLKVKYLRDIGVSEDSKVFHTALLCITRSGCNLDQKERILAKAGLSEEQIREVFRRCPFNLSRSVEKIQKVMDYLVSVAGLSPDVIVKYPKILGLSIEKRIKPRHEVFKYLSASGSFRGLKSLGRFIQISDKKFKETFVEGNPDAEQLLKIYGIVSSANRKKLGQS